jgi:hypothetical protein
MLNGIIHTNMAITSEVMKDFVLFYYLLLCVYMYI